MPVFHRFGGGRRRIDSILSSLPAKTRFIPKIQEFIKSWQNSEYHWFTHVHACAHNSNFCLLSLSLSFSYSKDDLEPRDFSRVLLISCTYRGLHWEHALWSTNSILFDIQTWMNLFARIVPKFQRTFRYLCLHERRESWLWWWLLILQTRNPIPSLFHVQRILLISFQPTYREVSIWNLQLYAWLTTVKVDGGNDTLADDDRVDLYIFFHNPIQLPVHWNIRFSSMIGVYNSFHWNIFLSWYTNTRKKMRSRAREG